MGKKKAKHGGRRPGAGRPLIVPGDPTHKVTTTLRESTLQRLAAIPGSRSQVVDDLVNQALNDAAACDDLAAAADGVLEGDPADAAENLAALREAVRRYRHQRRR